MNGAGSALGLRGSASPSAQRRRHDLGTHPRHGRCGLGPGLGGAGSPPAPGKDGAVPTPGVADAALGGKLLGGDG
jgi:hypothetical protein